MTLIHEAATTTLRSGSPTDDVDRQVWVLDSPKLVSLAIRQCRFVKGDTLRGCG